MSGGRCSPIGGAPAKPVRGLPLRPRRKPPPAAARPPPPRGRIWIATPIATSSRPRCSWPVGRVRGAAAELHPWLKPHAALAVRWMLAGGRRAVFASFGLHKTSMQLEACRLALAQLRRGVRSRGADRRAAGRAAGVRATRPDRLNLAAIRAIRVRAVDHRVLGAGALPDQLRERPRGQDRPRRLRRGQPGRGGLPARHGRDQDLPVVATRWRRCASASWPRPRRRPTSTSSCWPTPRCSASWTSARRRPGSSSATPRRPTS
jgi:hypothetical protein